MLVGSIEQGEQWIRAGAKIICYASEVEILRRGIMEAATRLHGDTLGGKEPTVMLMTTHPTPLQTKDLFYQALHGLHCCARSLDRRLSRGLVTIRVIARRFGV